MSLPKLVITDIDGVWTDGGMYYDIELNELKKFNTSDSAGVLFCRLNNIPVAIITGERTKIVERRAKKLQIKHLYQGIQNKLEVALKLSEELNISMNEVAYIGDDINDIQLLKSVGIAAAPNNAPSYIKDIVDIRLTKSGGDGAFREFIEHILIQNELLEPTINKYLNAIEPRNFDQ